MSSRLTHLSAEDAQLFFKGELAGDKARDVLHHLARGCSSCQALAREVFRGIGAGDPDEPAPTVTTDAQTLLATWDKARTAIRPLADALREERQAAPATARSLLLQPRERWELLLRNRPSFQTWALVEHFIELSWDSRYDNLAAMRELAEASVLVADSIPETRYGREAIHDLRGRARAYLANAWRANLDLRTAGRIFKEAEDELRQGTGDRLELGTLLYLKLNLFRRQGLWEEAHRACSRCQAIFERLDQPRMLARALAARAELFLFQDEFEPAIELCKRSLELLGGHDERFELSIRHNLALGLFHHGRKEEALARLQEARPLYFKVGDRLNQLRLRYFEGDIAASLNQYSLAEACLTEARDGMVANDVPWEAAEISLRLAEVYLVQGRMEACRELAEQLTPIFQARDFHTEAVAAMLLVREAMLAETVTAVMLQETVEFLRRLRQGS